MRGRHMRRARWHVPIGEMLEALPGPDGQRSAAVLARGDLEVELYAPRGTDEQRPHARDELYLVARGTGRFVCGGSETEFAPGDLLFVPAGADHRFVQFSGDLAVWVVFFGPQGGYGAG